MDEDINDFSWQKKDEKFMEKSRHRSKSPDYDKGVIYRSLLYMSSVYCIFVYIYICICTHKKIKDEQEEDIAIVHLNQYQH